MANVTSAAKPARPEKQGFVAETVEIVKTVAYALLIALVLRVVLFQPFTIPSASEEPDRKS
ncbi:MAG TPA: signal peptidase I, partial [Caulobacteraceae bacterium]|nr:signal peptidase I [Caulobacteraceae bacterium]